MVGHAGSWPVRPIPVLIVLLVAAAGLAGCTRGADGGQHRVSISVSPQAALVYQPAAVTVQGLLAGARTTLAARAKDIDGITWSSAEFQATSAGTVSLDQPSLGGSYTRGHVEAITVRLRAQGFAYPVTALRYRDAGHLIDGLTAYYGSLTDDALARGTVAATQAAQADAHAKLLALLASL